jgi:hypothetical protein
VPADDGLRFHNQQNLRPPGPDSAQGGPEQPVQPLQPRARPFPLEHGDLVPQGEDLHCSVMPTAEEDSDCGEESKDEFEHEPYVLT